MVSQPFAGFRLPPLAYAYDALEPFVDAETLRLHHDNHHQTYIDNLNKAIAPYPTLHGLIVEDLLCSLNEVPEQIRPAVRNHGGVHANHQFFWKVIGPPRDTRPSGRLTERLMKDFGALPEFQEATGVVQEATLMSTAIIQILHAVSTEDKCH